MQKRNYLFVAAIAATSVLFLGASRTRATEQFTENQATGLHRSIRVSGTAVVYGTPDYATVQLGVVKMSPRVLEAKSTSDQAMMRLQNALRKAGIEKDDIQTVNYQMYPVQPENKPNAARQWKVAHYISVKVRKVAGVASILDAAVANGATVISEVSYDLEKIAGLRSQAREQAMKVAKQKAQELAALSGERLGFVWSVTDSSLEPYYPAQTANNSVDYPSIPHYSSDVLSGGRIAVNAREDVEYVID